MHKPVTKFNRVPSSNCQTSTYSSWHTRIPRKVTCFCDSSIPTWLTGIHASQVFAPWGIWQHQEPRSLMPRTTRMFTRILKYHLHLQDQALVDIKMTLEPFWNCRSQDACSRDRTLATHFWKNSTGAVLWKTKLYRHPKKTTWTINIYLSNGQHMGCRSYCTSCLSIHVLTTILWNKTIPLRRCRNEKGERSFAKSFLLSSSHSKEEGFTYLSYLFRFQYTSITHPKSLKFS